MIPNDNYVNVNHQTWMIFVPIVAIWAYFRIEKLLLGIALHLVLSFVVSIPLQMLLPFPYGLGSVYAVTIPVNIWFIRK